MSGAALPDGLADSTCIHYSGHLAPTGPDETVLALVDGFASPTSEPSPPPTATGA